MARSIARNVKSHNRQNLNRMMSQFKGNLNNVDLDEWDDMADLDEFEPEERFTHIHAGFDDDDY